MSPAAASRTWCAPWVGAAHDRPAVPDHRCSALAAVQSLADARGRAGAPMSDTLGRVIFMGVWQAVERPRLWESAPAEERRMFCEVADAAMGAARDVWRGGTR